VTSKELISRVRNLKAPSPSVTKLITAVTDPDADNEKVIEIIRRDAALCAKLLSLCNRASVGVSSVASIDRAVMYLGHRAVHRLALSIGFGAALAPAIPGYAMNPTELWRHSLHTAFISQLVLEKSDFPEQDPSVAYTAGLVHDIGKLVIGQFIDPAQQQAILELLNREQCELLDAERQIIGVDHSEVGGLLLEKWGLPNIIIEAVAKHHNPAISPNPQLSTIVHTADLIAHQTGSCPGIASFALRPNEEAVKALGIDQAQFEDLLISALDAHQMVEEMAAAA